MPSSTKTQFGTLLREFRKRAGLTPRKLASYLNVDVQLIKELETGRGEPSRDPAFYQRFRDVPGFTEPDIIMLLDAAETDKYSEHLLERIIHFYSQFIVHGKIGTLLRQLVFEVDQGRNASHEDKGQNLIIRWLR